MEESTRMNQCSLVNNSVHNDDYTKSDPLVSKENNKKIFLIFTFPGLYCPLESFLQISLTRHLGALKLFLSDSGNVKNKLM